ncbi:MAG: hypothetical protein N838_22320 [Thiohalocapsa sp. PB-PSB1]|nr:MAG: hypothetical protein N838_22320 [Thiohalocapsa sp. PB-PSB1]
MKLQYVQVVSAFTTLSAVVIGSSLLSGCLTKNCRVYNENDPKLIDIEDRGRFLYEKEVIVEKEYRSINADAARLRTEFKELCENPPAAPEKNYERLSIAVQERKRLEAKLAEEL